MSVRYSRSSSKSQSIFFFNQATCATRTLNSVLAAFPSSSRLAMVVSRDRNPRAAANSCPLSLLAAPCMSLVLWHDGLALIYLPWNSLTSVGATEGISPETAADFSSGGFSNYFGIPDYQASAVSTYLSALGSTNSGRFNKTGRAFPDISTQGVDFEVVIDGSVEGVSGTSCASPTLASIISLLNDQLIAAGKSPLGFLNPFLYSTGVSALNDITSGSNPGCSTNGFPAKAGWDPVTGLGTPDFKKLLTAVGL